MVMIAARVRLAPELRSDEICCGRYVHLLNVEIHGWGNAPRNTPRLHTAVFADAVSTSRIQRQRHSSVLAVGG
jgi:hypothetical protein